MMSSDDVVRELDPDTNRMRLTLTIHHAIKRAVDGGVFSCGTPEWLQFYRVEEIW